jgi:repressor of nif and glnA expression
LHRTTFYKKAKKRIYKFDIYKKDIIKAFNESKFRYGSGRLSQSLYKMGIIISDRTLRNYMNRLNLKCITRVAKRPGEKKYKIFVPDLVQRDFHGKRIKAKATDVSYIPANELDNFVYLSATIDHKTKFVH